MGSSPLARGLQALRRKYGDLPGIIPARAGFTPAGDHHRHPGADHPRSRGVYGCRRRSCRRSRGSSPLARGLLHEGGGVDGSVGIIPARAGFTNQRQNPGRSAQDHPRSRGVYSPPFTRQPKISGSSPLARGLRDYRISCARAGRIIPARAGFTRTAKVPTPWSGGSSPLARGLQ